MGGTYRSARLPVRGPPATGRFRQKSTVGGQLSEKREEEEEEEKEEKKRKEEKKDLSAVRGPHPCAVAACGSPASASRQRPRTVAACESRALWGERSRRQTTVKAIEDAFKEFTSREDIAVVLISQYIANMIRFLVDSYSKPVPAILEIPSKDHPYDPAHDSVLSRVRYLFSAESVASGRR
ncbi:hypothetical protein BHE74_00009703 [Ensete ventricosum]|nr:hypothetical protein BHE74_00009703 [Ensete ventricosum]